jgi:hypothetical protein
MTACEVLAALHARGAVLTGKGDRLSCRAPAGTIPPDLRAAIGAHKTELLALIAGKPIHPPPGARVFFGGEDARPCRPEEAFLWTWEGVRAWFNASTVPIPGAEMAPIPEVEMVFALGRGKRCKHCVSGSVKLAWETFANGTRHVRADCTMCGRKIGNMKPPPVNPWIEYRATE